MKKVLFAAMALVALASCSSDEMIGVTNPQDNSPSGESNAIVFASASNEITRAGDLIGASAAEKLQYQFIVYGTKHASAEAATAANDELVFTNYKVEYKANTAGHTTSNTHNWEYVGLAPYAVAKVSPAATSATQLIKYWDYSAAEGYTFYGIASKADIETNNKVTITKTTTGSTVYDKGYSVVVKNGADLDELFVSDRLPVAKTNFNKPVTLKFRNFATRVRVGFYETIPGYKVKINKFYTDADAAAAVTTFTPMVDANTTNFAAALQNIKTDAESNTLAVTYYNGTDGPENQVKLGATTVTYNYALTLGTGIISATQLATSSAQPTWDQDGGAYTTVLPLEANTNPMLIKVDYTLTSEDGSNETIEVKGATAVVPTQYVKWKSNFAYTYIFKIAPNTNGTTDGTVSGLYPITFDAVVVDVQDDKTQETITTLADYSITSYANGSKVTVNGEYKANEDIYLVKTNNSTGAVVAPSAIGAYTTADNAGVYTVTTTGDAISEATVKAMLTGSPNGIALAAVDPAATLERYVPAADGTNFDFATNGAVKFTPSAAGTYVYIFTRIVNVPPTYVSVASAGWVAGTYYLKTTQDVYYPAAGVSEENFDANKANLYKKTADGTPGEYDIKIIKVVN